MILAVGYGGLWPPPLMDSPWDVVVCNSSDYSAEAMTTTERCTATAATIDNTGDCNSHQPFALLKVANNQQERNNNDDNATAFPRTDMQDLLLAEHVHIISTHLFLPL